MVCTGPGAGTSAIAGRLQRSTEMLSCMTRSPAAPASWTTCFSACPSRKATLQVTGQAVSLLPVKYAVDVSYRLQRALASKLLCSKARNLNCDEVHCFKAVREAVQGSGEAVGGSEGALEVGV